MDEMLTAEKIQVSKNPADMLTKTAAINKLKLCSISVALQELQDQRDLLHTSRCEDRLISVFKWEILNGWYKFRTSVVFSCFFF